MDVVDQLFDNDSDNSGSDSGGDVGPGIYSTLNPCNLERGGTSGWIC